MLRQHTEFDLRLSELLACPFRLALIDRVLYELQGLARTRSSDDGSLARVGLDVIDRKKIQVIETMLGLPDVDTSIVAFSVAHKAPIAVATLDRHLRATLSRFKIPTIIPKGRKGLLFSRNFASVA